VDLAKFAYDYNDAWNTHNVDAVVAHFADDGVLDDAASGETSRGVGAVRQAVSDWLAAFPDMHSDIEGRSVADESAVAYEWHLRATNLGPFMGREPTGRPIDFRGMALIELNAKGKVTRHADYVDLRTILTQLGHL
jgi:steroid delta-isomerase-like uncharacterized protein